MFLLKVFRFTMLLHVCSTLNLTRLIGIYMSSCGEHNLCKEWPGMINYESRPQLQRCPSCSCEEYCYLLGNCCPDKFYFERKLKELRTPTFFVANKDRDVKFPLYEFITTCPVSANDVDKRLCMSPPLQTKYSGPVTSVYTKHSYMNEYCAICHGEDKENITIWNFSTSFTNSKHIFNFVDSMEMLEKIAQHLQMTVIYSPPENLQSIVPPFYPNRYSLPTAVCPWDEDLQAACSSSYLNTYRYHRNIFCYMCSLPERNPNETNTALCHPKNLTVSHACTKNPISILTLPFQNIYCIICSRPPVLGFPYRQAGYVTPDGPSFLIHYVFEDFSAFTYENWINTEDNEKIFSIKFHSISFNAHSLLATIKNINVPNVSERIDEDWLHGHPKRHLANVLMITSSIYPWRICNMKTLPEVVQNITRKKCDCSFSCLFRAKCTCCIDTAIQHKVQCSSSYRSFHNVPFVIKNFEFPTKETKFLMVSTCFQKQNGNVSIPLFSEIKYLCEEQSNAFDLPVLNEGVTYKNVFCFICNSNIDVENDGLSAVRYKIMQFNIICNKQFHFMYKINLHEIFEEAERQSCGVVLDTQGVVLCDDYPTNIISTCKNKTAHDSLQWACEQLNRHSLPPMHQYKNEFCELCNQVEYIQSNETYDEEEKYAECNSSNQMHVQYEKACRSLPNVASHPTIFPHRNIFCSYCAHDDGHTEQVTSTFCPPKRGRIFVFPDQLIRRLFYPGMGFDSKISMKSKKDTVYGCFPGRMYERKDCRLAVAFQRNIRYSLHILSILNVVSASNDSSTVLSEIKDSVLAYLRKNITSMGCWLEKFYFIPKSPLTISYFENFYHLNMHVILHITLRYSDVFDRDRAERLLLRYPQLLFIAETDTLDKKYTNFDVKGLSFANISETMLSHDMHILPNEHLSFVQDYKDVAYFNASFRDIPVQELLICRHRKIPKKDVQLEVQNYRLIVLETRETFYVGEYVLDLNDMVGVCAPLSTPADESESTITEILEIISMTLNIVSTTGLVILLLIYLLIPSLRTLPGLNIMSSIFSLISMQVTFTITSTFEKMTLQCICGGILLHYFWLCMCCCLFICCLCMWRSFSASITTQISKNNVRSFTYFMLFSYMTPLFIVSGNVIIVYLMNGDVGYGKKMCFVDNKISNIVTFVFPLSLTCLVNTVLFLHTISKFRLDKTIRKSKQDTSELIIFGKLFSLTGCVWILQIIDGFFPDISTYSFVTTIMTSTQGLFIFHSFMTSPQIMKRIKCWKYPDIKNKTNLSNTRCPSTSRDTA